MVLLLTTLLEVAGVLAAMALLLWLSVVLEAKIDPAPVIELDPVEPVAPADLGTVAAA